VNGCFEVTLTWVCTTSNTSNVVSVANSDVAQFTLQHATQGANQRADKGVWRAQSHTRTT